MRADSASATALFCGDNRRCGHCSVAATGGRLIGCSAMTRRLLIWLLILLVLGGLALAWQTGWLRPPRHYDPFATLHVADPPTFVTGIKLRRLGEAEYCAAALASTQLDIAPVADAGQGGECRLTDAVRIAAAGSETGLRFSSSFLASCPLAVAYAMFERHALQPLAQQHFGQRVAGLQHLGSFACRNVRGGTRRSQHASANALDVAAVTLGDGRRISLRGDWQHEPSAAPDAEAAFLRDLRDGACRFFRTVLGPDYNAAHADHLHLDMGGFNICR